MKDDRRLADALHLCLEMIEAGATVESCLARYPDDASELEPLLRLAMVTTAAADAPLPPQGFRGALLDRLFQERRDAAARGRSWWPGLGLLARPWAVALGAVLLLVSSGLGVSSAAAGSIPGEPMYAVKSAQERFLLVVVPTDHGKAKLQARLALLRAWEMERLAARGRSADDLDRTAERLAGHARQVVVLMGGTMAVVGPPPADAQPAPPALVPLPEVFAERIDAAIERELRARLEMRLLLTEEMWRQKALQPRFLRGLPPGQRERMLQAYNQSQHGLYRAISALEQVDAQP